MFHQFKINTGRFLKVINLQVIKQKNKFFKIKKACKILPANTRTKQISSYKININL